MTDLTLNERITRLEELFKLHWGSLDIETQKKGLNELHQGLDRVKEKVDATSRKWDEYQQSEAYQDFLKIYQEMPHDTSAGSETEKEKVG